VAVFDPFPASADRPLPTGQSTVTVSYETVSGVETYSGARDFSGVGPVDATILGAAPNVKAFNAVNTFGRRTQLDTNPNFAEVLGDEESLVTHAFFKIDNQRDYFPELTEDGRIRLAVGGIRFQQRMRIHLDTLMLHFRWNDQNKMLDDPYIHIDDHHTYSASFRDMASFVASGFFAERPVPSFILADPELDWAVGGDGTDTLYIAVSFPYHTLMNFEETGQEVPEGLPAPQGFLEPFHFHIEYVVTVDTRPPPVEVQIDFDSTACPNSLDKRGRTVDVVVIGSPGFEVWRINLATLELARVDGAGEPVMPQERRRRGRKIRFDDVATPSAGGPCTCLDLSPDGVLDRVITFDTDEVIERLELGDAEGGSSVPVVLRGRLIDGTRLEGIDCIEIPERRR
jgi:hypothetical protein